MHFCVLKQSDIAQRNGAQGFRDAFLKKLQFHYVTVDDLPMPDSFFDWPLKG